MINAIRHARFELLTHSKHPFANLLCRETEWYADDEEKVLGTVFLDLTDMDWAFVILGRDEQGVFRWIDGDSSFESPDKARPSLQGAMNAALLRGEGVFPQVAELKARKNSIAVPVAARERLHPYFRALIENEEYSPAREVIVELGYAYQDLDGNFIEQLQTTGFDARLWELYLYAFLHEQRFMIDDSQPVPDYLCSKFGKEIAIEATTVGPTQTRKDPGPPNNPIQLKHWLRHFMPIKYGSALYSKLRKKYWDTPRVAGKPLVFAIHDFHGGGSMTWSSTALPMYLYGYEHDWQRDKMGRLVVIPNKTDYHEWEGKRIPSGFFSLPGSEHVSAVLFSNSATISKFNRMGKLADAGSDRVRMIRLGTSYNHDPDSAAPASFQVDIDPDEYDETWSEGVSIYHNPQAVTPIDHELFDGIAQHVLCDDGQIVSNIPPFHPLNSVTHIWLE